MLLLGCQEQVLSVLYELASLVVNEMLSLMLLVGETNEVPDLIKGGYLRRMFAAVLQLYLCSRPAHAATQ